MLRELLTGELKSGETMRVVCVTGPQPDWIEPVTRILYHKGEPWLEPIRLAFTEGIEPAVLNCYVGVVGDELVGNITTLTAANGQVGLLEHVFTPEQHRRKGIATYIMQAVTQDFVANRGRCMTLGTGYDTHPYWIYHSFGFRGQADSGHMIWRPDEGFDADWFAAGAAQVRDLNWADWTLLEILYCIETGWLFRSAFFGQVGFGAYEGEYVSLRPAIESGTIAQHKILERPDNSAVVGQAYLWRDDRFADAQFGGTSRHVYTLDFFVHPNHYEHIPTLLGSLDLDAVRKVQAFADPAAEERVAALEAAGFVVEATLPEQLEYRGDVRDVLVLGRR